MRSPQYQIVLSTETLEAIRAYKNEILTGQILAGNRLELHLKQEYQNTGMAVTDEKFIECLLATKSPRIFAESEIVADGSDWTHRELSLLGDINVAMPVEIFDNGVWDPSDPGFKEHKPLPMPGQLLFTPGALLAVGQKFNGISPDLSEITTAQGVIDQDLYNGLVERRLLPLLSYVNNTAKQNNKSALITLPGIGCGAFAGQFKGTMGERLNTALQTLLQKHSADLNHIGCIYYDPFGECRNEQKTINGIDYRVRPSALNPGKPQLSRPSVFEENQDNFSNHDLYKIVAWDHVSLPGNDYFANSRFTDDGVSAAATNSMQVITGFTGQYSNGDYFPPRGYKSWEDVVKLNKLRLSVTKNNLIIVQTGQPPVPAPSQPAQTIQPHAAPPSQPVALNNLSNDARGFLYGIFQEASSILKRHADILSTPADQTARDLSRQFRAAAFTARMSNINDVNQSITTLATALKDPVLKDAVHELETIQTLMFKYQVDKDPALQKDLGAYALKVF